MALRAGDVLAERYVIGSRLGKGAQAKTYAAVDKNSGEPVVVKKLTFSDLDEWKPYDLFEREARTLASLKHPRIPIVVDFFRQEDATDLHIYLVMTRAPGQSLAEKMAEGWHPTEDEVKRIAQGVLEILEYLHGLNPPVVHRDIKPSNLVQDEAGRIWLVDFGAVQEALRPQGGSTVTGTYGYMAPEQFGGHALPASDLYGLGATLVHVLSGVPPSQMPQKQLQLDFRSLVTCTPTFTAWLEHSLAPATENRFVSASEARRMLEHPVLSPPLDHAPDGARVLRQRVRRPAHAKSVLRRDGDKLVIAFPHMRRRIIAGLAMLLETGMCGYLATQSNTLSFFLFFIFLSLIFLVYGVVALQGNSSTRLEIDPINITVREIFHRRGSTSSRVLKTGKTANIFEVHTTPTYNRTYSGTSDSMDSIQLSDRNGRRWYKFGASFNKDEQEWLVAELRDYFVTVLPQQAMDEAQEGDEAESSTLTAIQQVDQTVDEYRGILRSNPGSPFAHHGMADAFAKQGLYEEAIREYELYLRYAPNAHDADSVRAIIDSLSKKRPLPPLSEGLPAKEEA